MEPIDLRERLPRSGRAELGGVVFLPRSIDKVRATLAGGNLADYNIEGFTTRMLDALGIDLAAFTEAVRTANSDEDVAAYVIANAKDGGAKSWNDYVTKREIYGGDRAEAIADHPFLADHPELVYTLDFLDYTDKHNVPT